MTSLSCSGKFVSDSHDMYGVWFPVFYHFRDVIVSSFDQKFSYQHQHSFRSHDFWKYEGVDGCCWGSNFVNGELSHVLDLCHCIYYSAQSYFIQSTMSLYTCSD